MQLDERTEVALWRFGVLGPLVSAELRHGDVRRLIDQAAARTHQRPDGRRVEVQASTIEAWFYDYQRGGFNALRPKRRSDAGTCKAIPPALADRIVALKRENMRRSVRRIIKMLVRSGEARKGQLKRSTVHRLLAAHGISHLEARPGSGQERRAFRPEHAGALWMGDVMHGPLVLADGRLRKSYLHLFMDAAVRLIVGAAFRLGETALDHQIVLKEAFRRHGLPRVLYLDLGAAQTANSLKLICAELGVRLLHCRPRDPEAKAGVERLIRTIRAEVMDELPDGPLPLEELNSKLWSWMAVEYHAREHGGTGRRPLEHWLEQADRLRPPPAAAELDVMFLHRVNRKVRKDSTVRFEGRMLEVRPELVGQTVELRFDPQQSKPLPQVYVDGAWFCDTVELDLVRNSARKRRPKKPAPVVEAEPTGIDPLQQLADAHARLARPPCHDEED